MNDADFAKNDLNIVPAMGSVDISRTMDEIGGRLGLRLWGEIQDLAGVLNSSAAYDVKVMQDVQGITSVGDWGYYAKPVLGTAGQMLKAWVRWNEEASIYDYYLQSDAGSVFSHGTPYVGTVR